MIAKFKGFNKILNCMDSVINTRKEDIDWYKFKVEQIANRLATPKPN
ncbi:Uncharacterised protein [Candidatus Tiddalikarchaeum anstoanum]|nr:Uncharacterised protein [Candidatus Tiddalikarchaeum anstoanum]